MKVQTTTQEKKQFEIVHVPTGLYLGTFVEEKPLEDHKEYGPQTGLIFEFEHDNKIHRLLWKVYTKFPATRKNKLGKAVVALGGKIDNAIFDTSSAIGAKANLYVKEYDKETEDNGKKTLVKASYIEDLIPLTVKA